MGWASNTQSHIQKTDDIDFYGPKRAELDVLGEEYKKVFWLNILEYSSIPYPWFHFLPFFVVLGIELRASCLIGTLPPEP
jgi:hypothetical protein